jgi:hypothetical protein
MNAHTDENGASIPQAAKRLGLDSFSLYGLIQLDKVRPQRARWGELVILQVEMDRILQKPTGSHDDEQKAR